MTQQSLNYEQHIYDTKECHIGKLNIRDYKNDKLIVLSGINESNYMILIKNVLTEKFCSVAPESVKFLIGSHMVLFKNLKFTDLENYIEHGYIFNIEL